MFKFLSSSLVFGVLVCGYAVAQEPLIYQQPPIVPVPIIQQQQRGGGIVPPNTEAWQTGWRETYSHEYRPLTRGYDNYQQYYPQQSYYPQYQQQHYYPQNQYYYPQNYCYPNVKRSFVPWCFGGD